MTPGFAHDLLLLSIATSEPIGSYAQMGWYDVWSRTDLKSGTCDIFHDSLIANQCAGNPRCAPNGAPVSSACNYRVVLFVA